jgi:hypothetical protein
VGPIGYVPQKAYLFSGTVASNLRFGRPDATDDELWEALEIAQAAGFVQAMPDGLDSPIAQGGTNVSGGQRQRLAIARASWCGPRSTCSTTRSRRSTWPPTPACGPRSRPRTRDAAVVVVAQRVATIRDADEILVLEDGEVVGLGTHDELLVTLSRTPRSSSLAVRRGSGGMSTNDDVNGHDAGATDDRELLATTGTEARRASVRAGRRGGHAGRAQRPDFGTDPAPLGEILGTETRRLVVVIALTVTSVVLTVLGPRCSARPPTSSSTASEPRGHRLRRAAPPLLLVGGLYLGSWALAASRRTCWPAWCSGRCTRCASRSSARSTASRCATSTGRPAATCSAGSPTTSTTSPRACSRRSARSSPRC